jgi:hypothetical protein
MSALLLAPLPMNVTWFCRSCGRRFESDAHYIDDARRASETLIWRFQDMAPNRVVNRIGKPASVTLEVTQEQIDREGKVWVTLPDGRVIRIVLQKEWADRFVLVRGPDPGSSDKYSVVINLNIIRPSQPA